MSVETDFEAQPVELGLMERARNFDNSLLARAAIKATALGTALGFGGVATEMAVNPVSVAADSVSTKEAHASNMDPNCVQPGLILPTVEKENTFMIRPGKKPWAHGPTKIGPIQEVRVTAKYQPMPEDDPLTPENESCSDYRRIGQVMLQKRVGPKENENDHKNDGWATMDYWSWIYSRDKGGTGGLIATPNGHEGDWYYERPDQAVRAQFRNLVRYLPTGKTITSHTKTVRVPVRWPKRHSVRH